MANLLRVQERREEALEAYRGLLEIDPNYALAHSYVGDLMVQLQRYEEAVEPLSKALRLIQSAPSVTPDLPTAHSIHVLLGTALRELGRARPAEAHFRQALALSPRNMAALEQVAAAEFRRRRYREALELYRTQLEIDPDKAATHVNVGAALFYLDRAEEAIRSLERALELDPTLETARENLEAMRKAVK